MILDPVKDYPINLISKLTPAEELQLAQYFRDGVQHTPESRALQSKALEPDLDQVISIVQFAQSTLKLITCDAEGWEEAFGGLPGPTHPKNSTNHTNGGSTHHTTQLPIKPEH